MTYDPNKPAAMRLPTKDELEAANSGFRFVAVATDLSNPGKLPFEQMTKEERLGLTDAKLHDKMVEFYDRHHDEWFGSGDTLFPKSIYRIPPEPEKTPDYFPFHLIDKYWKWFARDKDGHLSVFTDRPCIGKSGWLRDVGSSRYVTDLFTACYKRGTVDWKDSLLERPEGV